MVKEKKSDLQDIKKAQDNSENRVELKEVDNQANREELSGDGDEKSDSSSEDDS